MQRRKLLKSGLFTLGALSGLPQLSLGAFAGQLPETDINGNIIRSPMVREVLPGLKKRPDSIARKIECK